MKKIAMLMLSLAILAGCADNGTAYDASGSFEAVETIVSAEASGLIKSLDIEEGQQLAAGAKIGYIDTLPLHLRKKQLQAQVKATGTRIPDIQVQRNVFRQQREATRIRLNNLLHEQARTENLFRANAATRKQLDDILAQVAETEKQLQVIVTQEEAQAAVLQTQTSSLHGELLPLNVQIEQINDQLAKATIVNTTAGTVLVKYAEKGEMAVTGKPLFKIADISTIILRAYITGDQLPAIRLHQKVKVLVDAAEGSFKEYDGKIEWISSKAEFTPKTIQTKDERANQVYAIKIRVQNDGFLKIGMYGEVKF